MSHLLPFVLRFYIKGLLALKYIMLNCNVDVIQVKWCITSLTSLTVEIFFYFFFEGERGGSVFDMNKGQICTVYILERLWALDTWQCDLDRTLQGVFKGGNKKVWHTRPVFLMLLLLFINYLPSWLFWGV